MKPFPGKKQNFQSWDDTQVPDYQDIWIIKHQIKGILVYYYFTAFTLCNLWFVTPQSTLKLQKLNTTESNLCITA
jgi:hypothetical protein